MKIGIGLAAALAVAILSPSAAFAQGKPNKAADAAMGKMRQQGMAEAPAAVQAKGLTCTISDAIYLGESDEKSADGKKFKSKIYEVACQEGLGYLVGSPSPAPLDCLTLQTASEKDKATNKKSNVPVCRLPANADPKMGLSPILQKAGVSCAVTKGRWVGLSATAKINQYEVGCADGQAFMVVVPDVGSTAKQAVESCLKAASGGVTCEYFSKEAAIQGIKTLAAKSGRTCQISDARYVATKTSGGEFFEIGCTDGKSGYMVETDKNGAFSRAIECARAEPIAGGCTFTQLDNVGSNEEAGLYSKKAKEIGFACTVNKYRSLGLDGSGREVAELGCSDRADGAFALIPINPGQKGETYNCVRAEARNQTCRLSQKSAVYEKLHNQLENKGKACQVASTRGVGQTATGEDVVEVACTGSTGVIVTFYKDSDGIGLVTPCDKAQLVGGCKIK